MSTSGQNNSSAVCMLHTGFSFLQILLLIISILFGGLSWYYYRQNKERRVFLFLFFTAFSLFSFASLLTPFLNPWDERFHALVAKNLINHPLMPTLYDTPIVDMAYDRWDRFHIWLHKQPLFLWQIAFSFSIFGFSEYALRLPSILLGALFILTIYRTGSLISTRRLGLIASFLALSSLYLTELIGGIQPVDHNDVSFLAYISLSIWAMVEYYHSRHRSWIVLIGIFSGLAILCKWLTGLIVYPIWCIIWFQEYRWKITQYLPILYSLCITILVFAPWQFFILHAYPTEALYEYTYNSLHLTEAVEGHGGSWFYHFQHFSFLYGSYTNVLIIPALFTFYVLTKNKRLYHGFVGMIFIVYGFFSAVGTKMPAFTLITALPTYLALGSLFEYLFQFFEKKFKNHFAARYILIGLMIFIFIHRYNFHLLSERYSPHNPHIEERAHNKKVFLSFKERLPPESVLFNVANRQYIEAMFYSGFPSYSFVPTETQYHSLKRMNKTIAIIALDPNGLPEYLKNDPTVIILPEILVYY